VIYLDSSVVLARLFAEDRTIPDIAFQSSPVSSRLLEYEVWNRVHARGFTDSHGDETRALLARVVLLELSPEILARALEPFPTSVRTLDGLHLATILYLQSEPNDIELASFDERLCDTARVLGIALYVP
jgi:predicted nucleic acid-binding protein